MSIDSCKFPRHAWLRTRLLHDDDGPPTPQSLSHATGHAPYVITSTGLSTSDCVQQNILLLIGSLTTEAHENTSRVRVYKNEAVRDHADAVCICISSEHNYRLHWRKICRWCPNEESIATAEDSTLQTDEVGANNGKYHRAAV